MNDMSNVSDKSYTFTNKRTSANLGTYAAADHLQAMRMMARAQGCRSIEDWSGATGDMLNLYMVTA
jgi:hypothetical protein